MRWPSLLPSREQFRTALGSSREPLRTALACGIGGLVGGTPVIGVHSYAAPGAAALFRLPPGAAFLGASLSNPLTFIPITLLEIRIGQWMLGQPPALLPRDSTFGELGAYYGAAWMGFLLVGPAMALLAFLGSWWFLTHRGKRRYPGEPGGG